MFKRLCREFFLGVALLFMLCLGFATPALAEGEPTYAPSDAKLTAVIVAPVGTDASQDSTCSTLLVAERSRQAIN